MQFFHHKNKSQPSLLNSFDDAQDAANQDYHVAHQRDGSQHSLGPHPPHPQPAYNNDSIDNIDNINNNNTSSPVSQISLFILHVSSPVVAHTPACSPSTVTAPSHTLPARNGTRNTPARCRYTIPQTLGTPRTSPPPTAQASLQTTATLTLS